MDEDLQERLTSGREPWWKDWRYVASVAALLFAFGISAFVVTTYQTRAEVQSLEPVLERLNEIAESNSKELAEIERANAGVQELVDFVRDIQERSDDDDEGSNLQIFVDLLCASSDPVRIEACEIIKQEGIMP